MIIHVATNNSHKLGELQALLPGHILRTARDAGFADFDVVEDGQSFAENSWIKAQALYQLIGRPVLADDSGLCVDALDGRPGIHSARYGSTAERLLESPERNALLLGEMQGKTQRSCRFVCCLTLIIDAARSIVVQETCEGELLLEPRGAGGFGYDPLVYLAAVGKSVAELSESEKNRLSHRGRAIRRLLAALDALPE
ncbi:MAG: RdgB/HAM1 family non-canonical purine NTP pyrophosphatase [Spirochaetes bacterium]|nr:RdgB/HAM1 family non-canonical purine NTP pyrophosphatase [Spirochaetota bacterium]MBU0955745.1 RdgB/HAM1 family non-canonical purine NTP pyrophosphatase [Spirochaetota bacterium]